MKYAWLQPCLVVSVLCGSCPAATSREIQQAIDHAKAYLYSRQKTDGTWEESAGPQAGKRAYETTGGQWGGLTALATYALLAAGDNPRDHHLAPAVGFCSTANMQGVYALGLAAQVWSFLPQDAAIHNGIARQGRLLLGALKRQGEGRGMYGYLAGGGDDPAHLFDHSVSQYGVLGMWALQEAGLEVPDAYWAAVDAAWRRDQLPDGGWSYYGRPQGAYPASVSMTAAGVASLFLSDDYLRAGNGLRCMDDLADRDIDRGLAWIAAHFDSVFEAPNRSCYALYGIERIGAASGRKTFGGADWFDRGAEFLLAHQSADSGAWDQGDGPVADTAFALLFLVRGRAPVVLNKLDYSSAPGGAQWNQRPRDAAHLARWISRTIEANRPLNWQVVSLAGEADDWHDAPVLYVCGRAALRFTGEQQAKLKRYAEDGGVILFNADCADSRPFVESVFAMGRSLFGREFRAIPGNHPIYKSEEFHGPRFSGALPLLGLSNGARELMILIPDADFSAAWQVNTPLPRREAFETAADIFLYAVDKENLRVKGESYLAAVDPAAVVTRRVKVARVNYGADYDPEPGGWRRLGTVMHNRDGVDLEVTPVTLGDGALGAGGFAVAHLTGTEAMSLPAAGREELGRFVRKGGTLIVDAAGGSRAFAESARRELGEIFGAQAGQLDTPLTINHPIYSGIDPKLYGRDIHYRLYSLGALADLHSPRLRGIAVGERVGVYFSAEDLSVGLVGQPVDGIVGYTPEVATRLMERMILAGSR